MIQVLIADDHLPVRRGLRRLLQQTKDMEVVGEASDGLEAVELAQQLQPDVVVMDISMPNLDGIQALTRIQEKQIPTRVVILSMHAGADFARLAQRQGAYGYVLKRQASRDLKPAIRAAWRGETYFAP
jgi:two-component system, NarL family, response regulator NreC